MLTISNYEPPLLRCCILLPTTAPRSFRIFLTDLSLSLCFRVVGAMVVGAAVCSRIPGLAKSQREQCRKAPHAMPAVGEGAALGLRECRHQFRHHRWNCSHVSNDQVFGHVVVVGKKDCPVTARARARARYLLYAALMICTSNVLCDARTCTSCNSYYGQRHCRERIIRCKIARLHCGIRSRARDGKTVIENLERKRKKKKESSNASEEISSFERVCIKSCNLLPDIPVRYMAYVGAASKRYELKKTHGR